MLMLMLMLSVFYIESYPGENTRQNVRLCLCMQVTFICMERGLDLCIYSDTVAMSFLASLFMALKCFLRNRPLRALIVCQRGV